LCAPIIAGALACAAPAHADQSEYLKALQPRLPFLSTEQLLTEGSRVCASNHSGRPSADAVPTVSKDLGVSVSVASDIVAAAVVHLDC
jgi:hypothetical protein